MTLPLTSVTRPVIAPRVSWPEKATTGKNEITAVSKIFCMRHLRFNVQSGQVQKCNRNRSDVSQIAPARLAICIRENLHRTSFPQSRITNYKWQITASILLKNIQLVTIDLPTAGFSPHAVGAAD